MDSRLASTALFAFFLILLGFRDANARPERPAALDSTGRETYIYTGPDVEFGMTNAEVRLDVPDLFLINDVDVLVSITHTYDSDVTLLLENPNGQLITLVSNTGFSEDNFISTVFDDSAAISIQEGFSPFTGSFRPIEALSTFNGGAGIGTWTLYLEDIFPTEDDGVLTQFELTLSERIGGTVRGTVSSLAASAPLEGVTIEFVDTPHSTVTDALGHYFITAPEGTYDLQISYPGWCGERFNGLELANYDTTNVDAALRRPVFVSSVSSLNLMARAHGTGSGAFRIQNGGDCDLTWSSDPVDQWLSVHPPQATFAEGEGREIILHVDAFSLSEGDYYSEITITHNAVESPRIIPVLLTVVEGTNADPDGAALPTDFALIGSFPNPFNGSTTLRFALPQTSTVQLSLYANDGRLAEHLSSQVFAAGVHDLQLDLNDLASGVYFAVLNAGNFTRTQKLILIK
jgi:subtilisin-like proprotein convertase family protein